MALLPFLERLRGCDPASRRTAWRVVVAILLLYAVGMAIFWPRIATNEDEAAYLRQARLLIQGDPVVHPIDPLTGEASELRPSTYAVGTAALLVPFYWVAGRSGTYLVPLLSLLIGVWLTARWIADAGRSPLFALIILGFPPALVMGRVCMSDAPSLAIAALGLWLFWRGQDSVRNGWWLGSGFVAGLSLSVRPTNAVLFAPLFAGTVLRGERRSLLLLAGGLAGSAVRLVAHWWHFGDPFYERTIYPFAPWSVMSRLPLYLLGLLVFVPGGLAAGLAYRARRRPEIVATVILFFSFYLFQVYGSDEVGGARRMVLALRYFVPLLPVLAFAMAEAVPRWFAAWLARGGPERREARERVASGVLAIWLLGVAVAAFGVHPAFDGWSARQARIAGAIDRGVGLDEVVVTNLSATRKFLREVDRRYTILNRSLLQPGDVERLIDRHGSFYVAFLDRGDSEFFRRDARENARFISAIDPPPDLQIDLQATSLERLRIWRVTGASEARAPDPPSVAH